MSIDVSVEVTLTQLQMRLAALEGVERMLRSMRYGRGFRGWGCRSCGRGNYGWENDVNGAAAEYAVALTIGREWNPGVDPDYDGDIGPGLQVRWSSGRKEHLTHLIVYPKDTDDHVFFLVTGGAPKLSIEGWLRGGEAKQPNFWKSDCKEPSWWVPLDALKPMPDRTPQLQSSDPATTVPDDARGV